jgi:Xaa-Pro aminopeptidase
MSSTAIDKLRQELLQRRLDALFITKGKNVSYLSGFAGESGLLLTPTRKVLVVDFRFKEEAAKTAASFQIYQRPNLQTLEESLLHLVKKLKLKRLGFEALSLSYQFYRRLKSALHPVKLVPTDSIVEQLRAIKTAAEIKLLKKAAGLAAETQRYAQKIIKPGKEETEISRELQYFMRKLGAEACAFEPIVASGKRSSMPHACASDKIIKDKEAVLVDLGCRISGYNSDLTRMVFLGKMRGKIKRIYATVIRAQKLAIQAVRPGEKILRIDKIARQCIAKEGLGGFFGHALGHGIGREVHEYPSISPNSQGFLRKGMVFTIEPGIYIPGWGGAMVEEMVLVTKTGHEVLAG